MVGVKGLTRKTYGVNLTAQMDKSTEPNHWKTTLIAQGRSLKWLASATSTPERTVYAYSSGQRKTPAAWLAKASTALGEDIAA
jgi:hypothetical protein